MEDNAHQLLLTQGLKAELLTRLQEAIDSETTVEPIEAPIESIPTEDLAPPVESEVPPSDDQAPVEAVDAPVDVDVEEANDAAEEVPGGGEEISMEAPAVSEDLDSLQHVDQPDIGSKEACEETADNGPEEWEAMQIPEEWLPCPICRVSTH